MNKGRTILEIWDVTPQYFTEVVLSNPSLRGMILGYLAERKLRDVFEADSRITATRKDDDHDRKKKGDLVVTYKGSEFKIEVKSLQTNGIKIFDRSGSSFGGRWVRKIVKRQNMWIETEEYKKLWRSSHLDARHQGQVQCDASDKRTVTFPDGEQVQTTSLQVGEFDILAAGLFTFREHWDFGFALNSDLPRSTFGKISTGSTSAVTQNLYSRYMAY